MADGEIYVSMAKGNIKNCNTFPTLSKAPRKKMDKKPVYTFPACLGSMVLLYFIRKYIPFLGNIATLLFLRLLYMMILLI